MKKRLLIMTIISLILICVGLVCYSFDNVRFKLDYEWINNTEFSNGKKIKVNIPINNRIKYIKSEEKLIKFLKNDTGILYIGYNTCPWCRNAVPILIDSIIDNNIGTLYYVDIHKFDYKNASDELNEILDEYLKEMDDGTRVIAVPDVYAVKKGKIVAHHRGCVESYKNPYKGMSDKQKDELKKIYDDMIKEIK